MEDLVIPILNSGIAEDKQKPISSDASTSMTSYLWRRGGQRKISLYLTTHTNWQNDTKHSLKY